ncbi:MULTISPECIES: hypothetical protein [unclassified Lysobacter]|uniref:hypothetical protein n=1 Tax=unclassified Lysobacter TaxID=2635362 RepID=UPI001C210ED8|nr:hypothetical protein [Lysobacter sp. MMG2]MBU8975809.1 hypothetical protein [Lysobacter sp. MMG2]
MSTAISSPRPVTYWIVAALALLWNLLGVLMFCMQLAATPGQIAMMPPEQRLILESTPSWLQAAYGVAVFGGVLGAIGLLMSRRWAATFFLLSLLGLIVQIVGTFTVTPAWAALGPAGLIMPILLLLIALFLLSYARRAAARGWLR